MKGYNKGAHTNIKDKKILLTTGESSGPIPINKTAKRKPSTLDNIPITVIFVFVSC